LNETPGLHRNTIRALGSLAVSCSHFDGCDDPFDGRWIFTGAGCRGAGSVPATIKGGKVMVRGGGGNVIPDGIIHTVGAGNGMTLTAEGRLSGDSGSGTYDRSDGCSGTWIGIKRTGSKQRR
jgi:hypothetical protein